ncbi:MAG: PQQ-binding-like beta-propeller repeat protein [Pirellulaceae bacterium]
MTTHDLKLSNRNTLTRFMRAIALMLSVFCLGEHAFGQVIVRRGNLIIRGGQVMDLGSGEMSIDEQAEAALKTDPDLEAILEKAKRYLEDGNFTVAAQLWQVVLEKSGDTLFSLNGRTYFSMVEQVEETLSSLPADALKVYRVNADAEARQILARTEGRFDAQALNEVVRKYFVSSVGDDAAFQLAAVAMDRFDFLGALRLLEKIQLRHPDPSISKGEILQRIALCQLMLGNRDELQNSLQALQPIPEAQSQLEQLQTLASLSPAELNEQFSLTTLSSFRNYQQQVSLPPSATASDLFARWQSWIGPESGGVYNRGDVKGHRQISTAETATELAKTVSSLERQTITNWQQNQWRPVDDLIVRNDQVVVKSVADVSSWSTSLMEEPVWRSLWLNAYAPDATTKYREAYQNNNWGNQNDSRIASMDGENVKLFGDVLHAQMNVVGSRLYTIEGEHDDNTSGKVNRGNRGIQYNVSMRRSRDNFLTCYEADTGRLLWVLPQNSEGGLRPTSDNAGPAEAPAGPEKGLDPFLVGGGFMGAPIGYGELILVPVNISGAIYIYALDPKLEGKTVWRTYLCDEPETGASAWAPIQLTLDGSDLFVASGLGVIFVLDPSSGLIRFAQRYDRVGEPDNFMRQFGNTNRFLYNGWTKDIVIPYGRQMICFCSDSDQIFAIDRTTGETIWYVEMRPFGCKLDYIIGIHDNLLFAGGSQMIVAFDLLGEGRMAWGGPDLFDGGTSFGRAMIAGNSLLVPINDSIWEFALKAGELPEKQSQLHVELGTGEPVGNLYSDGQTIWVRGGTRTSALAPVSADSKSTADETNSESP